MQVSATLIAAQQAAREAQARFQAQHVAKPQTSSFASALDGADAFAPLPLKQTVPAEPASPAAPSTGGRMGALLDIKV